MDALPEQSASAQLAAYVAALDISDLPPHVVHEAKRALLDTVGAALAGARADETDRVVAAVRDYDAASVATLWGRPERASVPAAALINGTAAHARELDDWLALVHAGAVVVPATLAMAEMVGASGARVIEATVAGYEVASRVSEAAGLAAQYRRGWHPTGTCGAFGAAAAAAKVIGLGADATTLALGLAGSFTGGIWAFIADGAMSKRLHPGKAAEVGVVAALLARRGFTGPRYVFEAPFGGFLSTYVPGEFDLAKLTEDLGRFKILENGYKPYACCRGIHAALDAALTLWHGARFAPDDVQSVRVAVPYEVYLMCGATRVDSLLDAQMSLAFSLGVALARGAVRLSDYERLPPEPAVQRLMQLVEVKVNDQLENEAAVVTIGLRDGRTLSERVDVGRGDSTTPLSDAELVAKFEELATRALPSSAIRASRDALLEAETLDSVVPLLRELARVVTV
jgi:2-methylcitrate dehydratase PrpD